VQKCDPGLCTAPAAALTTAGDKPLFINVIIVFQANSRRSGRPGTYAEMQYTPLNRHEKCLAILTHCCFVWQYCNIDKDSITYKRRDFRYSTAPAGRRVRRRAHRFIAFPGPGFGKECRSRCPDAYARRRDCGKWHRVCYKSSDDGMGVLLFGRQV